MDEQDQKDEALNSETPNAANAADAAPTTAEAVAPPNFGEYLRQAREAQGLSLKQVSQKTKINTTQLDFLEQGMIEKLPNKAYVIGYVKSYAKTIGLDLEHCLQLLEQAYRPLNPPPATVVTPESTPLASPKIKAILGAGAGLVAIIVIILLAQHRSPKQAPAVAPAVTPNFAIVEESPVPNVTATIAEAALKVTATLVATVTPEVRIATPETSTTKTANQSTGALYRLGPSDSEEVKKIPENIRQAMVKGKQNIFIMAAEGDSWITYKKDNDPIRKLMLKQGENLRLVGDDVRIFAGNVTAIKLFLNNRPVEFQSTTGLKSFIFPQENIKRYKLPLFVFKEDGSVETNE